MKSLNETPYTKASAIIVHLIGFEGTIPKLPALLCPLRALRRRLMSRILEHFNRRFTSARPCELPGVAAGYAFIKRQRGQIAAERGGVKIVDVVQIEFCVHSPRCTPCIPGRHEQGTHTFGRHAVGALHLVEVAEAVL